MESWLQISCLGLETWPCCLVSSEDCSCSGPKLSSQHRSQVTKIVIPPPGDPVPRGLPGHCIQMLMYVQMHTHTLCSVCFFCLLPLSIHIIQWWFCYCSVLSLDFLSCGVFLDMPFSPSNFVTTLGIIVSLTSQEPSSLHIHILCFAYNVSFTPSESLYFLLIANAHFIFMHIPSTTLICFSSRVHWRIFTLSFLPV